MAGGDGHRSTLKQKNKSHNHGKHRSKRNIKREAHGKINVKQLSKEKKLKEVLRQEAAKHQGDRRSQELDARRGTASLPPRLVVVVSLDRSVDTPAVVELLREADLSSHSQSSSQKILHVSASKLKNRMCFYVPEYGDLQSLLDAARVADVLLFVVGEEGIDKYGDYCLACLLGQGVPAHVFTYQGLSNLSKKKLSDTRKRIEKQIDKRFPGDKFRSIDTWQDAQTLWRQVANLALKTVHFRDVRPYLIAESVDFEANPQDEQETMDNDEILGTLKVTGYLRGQSLDVNQLVHLPGWGDFQMSQIDESADPYPLVPGGNKDRRQKKHETGDEEMKEATPSSFCLAKATRPESLQSEVIPDEMDQEQTWPTAEELGAEQPVKKKMLKGVSDYQSSWIVDLEDDEEDSDDDDSEDKMDDEMVGNAAKSAEQGTEMDDGDEDLGDDDDEELKSGTVGESEDPERYDATMDLDEDRKMYERLKEERQHVHFPDEVDTPMNIQARDRFARYRGMDSFNTTAWDPNDSLPYDYARIYRVSKHHYKRLRKIALKGTGAEEDEGENILAEPGNFITVHVKNVPKPFIDAHRQGMPVSLYGLFPHEQKMTLISVLIMRAPGFKTPVKAKDPLIFQIGFRRFSACPIFSEHAFQNKFRMERFLPQSGFVVASMFAPIMFAPAPVLVFRENLMGKQDLVAKGSLLPLDTDRIVVKRVVLSGAPFKINKKSVVVRYMFFSREDIEFFKPLELRTKWGKRGHIKQALGTHGHMKCTFNGQLKSEDTVLLNLYKRVFPKWDYQPLVSILPPVIQEERGTEEEDDEEMQGDQEESRGEAYQMFD